MNELVMLAAKIDRCTGEQLIREDGLRRLENMDEFCEVWHAAYHHRYDFPAGPARWRYDAIVQGHVDDGSVRVRVHDAGSVDDAGQVEVIIGALGPIALYFNSGTDDGGFFLAEVHGDFDESDASRASIFDMDFGGAISRYLGRDTASKAELLLLSKIHRMRMVANDGLRKHHEEAMKDHMVAMLEAVERVNAIERQEDGE